jgi:hypothetical protein
MKTKVLLATVAAAALVAVGAGIVAAGADASPPDEIQAARAATARYHSFEQALADGYTIEGEPCVQEAAGAMGIHAVNHTLAGDLTIDPLRPEILLYLPDGNGNLRLVGVEYFTVALTPTGPWFGSEPPDGGFVTRRPPSSGRPSTGRCRATTRRSPGTTTCTSGSGRTTPPDCSHGSTPPSPARDPAHEGRAG